MASRNAVTSVRLSDLTRSQIDELTAKWGCSMADLITLLVDRTHREEMKNMNSHTSTVTLKFVAQSGHVWEETVDADEVDAIVEQTVATHGDIERVERLENPDDMSGKTIWRFE